MKRFIPAYRLLASLLALFTLACSGDEAQAQNLKDEGEMMQKLNITIDGQTLTATLVENAATRTLMAALAEGPVTYEADDYGGFEKVGALGRSLPTCNEQITTQAGDVILYNGNQVVLFYGSNSWSYTRLGHLDYDSLDQLKAFLKAGQGRVSVTLSAGGASGVRPSQAEQTTARAYTLSGTTAAPSARGVAIKGGKKTIHP